MTSAADIPVASSSLTVERVRHSFRARHVQLLSRQLTGDGFVRVTVGSDELTEFVSAGFGDHVKVLLPQAGSECPALPRMEDGRPTYDGERPTMRDYTPLNYNAQARTLDLEFALHGTGPAAQWAANAPIGQWIGLAGPRGSMIIPTGFDWHWLLGDDSSLPAIERRLSELPAQVRVTVRLQKPSASHAPANLRTLRSAAQLDVQWVDSLADATLALQLPQGEGYIWAAGENGLMAELRSLLMLKPGINPKRMYLSAYWKRGVADHHETLAVE